MQKRESRCAQPRHARLNTVALALWLCSEHTVTLAILIVKISFALVIIDSQAIISFIDLTSQAQIRTKVDYLFYIIMLITIKIIITINSSYSH